MSFLFLAGPAHPPTFVNKRFENLGGRIYCSNRIEERMMEYDLKAMDREIKLIEESVGRLRELGGGIEVVERNADSILAFTFLLKRSISDILE
jgi:hypothetical protein